MGLKKITLTEDHLKLIRALKFESFTFGEKYNLSKIDNALEDIKYRYEKAEDSEAEDLSHIILSLNKARRTLSIFNENRSHFAWGVDQWSPWGGNYVLQDIALLIGKYDEVIPETVEDTTGPRFPEELEAYMLKLYHDIADNLELIVGLVFQFSTNGGLTVGTYKCIDYEGIWEKM